MNQYLERCLRDVHLDEQDLNRKIEQRLQYITDMNQLLQLKLNMLETKFGEHILLNPLSIPLPLKRLSSLSSNSNGQQTLMVNELNPVATTTTKHQSDYLATKLAYDQMSTATLSSVIFSGNNNQSSKQQQQFEMINQPSSSSSSSAAAAKTIAYVQPNVRKSTAIPIQSLQQQQQQQSTTIQRSISTDGPTSNLNDDHQTDNNSNSNNSEHHSSRRCRRHHRIRLFSHRRRH
uniref:Uncharacterized protein LOC113799764 n=1 Tax=Dermatophagoides pteronyssinus TaxID=6956 RepID=A0A6P6YL25_DERPT|nr:uncharacterized protein LOC113799764 [Dermatophagoides pteronyssinus]